MTKKAKKGKLFSSIVSAFSKKAARRAVKPKKKAVKKLSKKEVRKPVKKIKRKTVIKKMPVRKIKGKAVIKKKVSKIRKKKVKKEAKKVVKKPKAKKEEVEVGFEEVVIQCPSCGREFRIVKSSGFSTEGMLCQRCAAGGGMGLEEEGEF